jgi:hypothetical protein
MSDAPAPRDAPTPFPFRPVEPKRVVSTETVWGVARHGDPPYVPSQRSRWRCRGVTRSITNVASDCSVSEMFVKWNLAFGLIWANIGFAEPLSYHGPSRSHPGSSMESHAAYERKSFVAGALPRTAARSLGRLDFSRRSRWPK